MTMIAGVAKVDITPPIGLELSGYGYYRNRKSTGISDALYSKAIVLSDGTTRVAIVSNDLIGLPKEVTKKVREEVSKETGIPKENILLACTHTHSGPATIYLRGCGEVDKDYLRVLPKYIAGAIIAANSRLQDAKIGAGKGYVDGISLNREVENGPNDPEVGVIRVDDANDNVIATITNFSCHPVVMPVNSLISGDYPGTATSFLEKAIEGSISMFLQGACGDINPILKKTGKVRRVGISLAAEALKVEEQIQTTQKTLIKSKIQNVKLPLDIPRREDAEVILSKVERFFGKKLEKVYAEWIKSMIKKIETNPKPWLNTEIQAIRIGDILLVAEPAELYVKFGLEIKRRSKYKNTFVVGFSNDYVGYIPDEEDYAKNDGFGSYAARVVPVLRDNFFYKPEVGKIIVEATLRLINNLS
ncbi:MAG: neutral/alkaline non-lysosomal ceramidase N-terminal domain-containing protein [Candidatus Bathyarchaeia archaeon]